MKYKIKIPTPCYEKWDNMSPTEKGRFCSNCHKEVLDYTRVSNNQLAGLLNGNQKICGKFRPEQLNTDISISKKKRHWNISMLLGLSAFLFVSRPVYGQDKPKEEITKINPLYHPQEKDFIPTNNEEILITGQVYDENGGIPDVHVALKDHSYGTKTNMDGIFAIHIKKETWSQEPTLVFSALRYEKQEVKLNEKSDFIKIELVEDTALMGEVIIIRKQNIFEKTGRLFRKKP